MRLSFWTLGEASLLATLQLANRPPLIGVTNAVAYGCSFARAGDMEFQRFQSCLQEDRIFCCAVISLSCNL